VAGRPYRSVPGSDGANLATENRKPPGTIGAEVWLALTPPHEPAPPLNSPAAGGGGSYKFLSVSSRGNLQTDFPSAEAGKIGGRRTTPCGG
jgi:hypothetical protein